MTLYGIEVNLENSAEKPFPKCLINYARETQAQDRVVGKTAQGQRGANNLRLILQGSPPGKVQYAGNVAAVCVQIRFNADLVSYDGCNIQRAAQLSM